MQALDLPPFEAKLTQSATNQPLIWDGLRRKHVVLTPEEWVRQHVVHYLITHLGYPRGLLALERGLRYNQRQKRTDLLALDPAGQPLLLVECKAPAVPITRPWPGRPLPTTRPLGRRCCCSPMAWCTTAGASILRTAPTSGWMAFRRLRKRYGGKRASARRAPHLYSRLSSSPFT